MPPLRLFWHPAQYTEYKSHSETVCYGGYLTAILRGLEKPSSDTGSCLECSRSQILSHGPQGRRDRSVPPPASRGGLQKPLTPVPTHTTADELWSSGMRVLQGRFARPLAKRNWGGEAGFQKAGGPSGPHGRAASRETKTGDVFSPFPRRDANENTLQSQIN